MHPQDAFHLDGALGAAVTPATKLVLLATPNNPTVSPLRTSEIAELLTTIPSGHASSSSTRRTGSSSTRLFRDPVRELVPEHPNVVVTRTFSKAQGLAGIRIGYAVGHPEVIAAVGKTLFPFAVNAIAQAAGIAAIDAEAEIGERVAVILAERSRVVAAHSRRLQAPHTQANFVYLPSGRAPTRCTSSWNAVAW